MLRLITVGARRTNNLRALSTSFLATSTSVPTPASSAARMTAPLLRSHSAAAHEFFSTSSAVASPAASSASPSSSSTPLTATAATAAAATMTSVFARGNTPLTVASMTYMTTSKPTMKSSSRAAQQSAATDPPTTTDAKQQQQGKKSKSIVSVLAGMWVHVRERSSVYLVLAGMSVVAYGFWRVGMNVAGFFSALDFHYVAKVSFLSGLVSAAALGGVGLAASRLVGMKPEHAYRATYAAVLKDKRVAAELGGSFRPGSFRAYSYDDALSRRCPVTPQQVTMTSRFDSVTRFLRPRTLQLMFSVHGSDGSDGIVAAEIVNMRGNYKYNLLALNVLPEPSCPEQRVHRHVLAGDPAKQIYFGNTRLR